ncbi:MAG: sulfatase-like hydrolase/transferase [Planctomycetota bacterium]
MRKTNRLDLIPGEMMSCQRLVNSLFTIALIFLHSVFLQSAICHADDRRPNIVLIMVDDMGFSDIGCYGGEIETSNLDALAAGGVRFDQFYNSGRCCPTRATLLTGLHPHQAGIGLMTLAPGQMPSDKPANYQGFLNKQCVTIAEVLRSGGYRTMMTGKWHLGMHDKSLWPKQRGFDDFYGIVAGAARFFHPIHPRGITSGNQKIEKPESTTDESFYATDAFTDHALRFINEHQADANDDPFFLYLSYNAPHWPLQAFEDDIAKYRGKYREGWEALRQSRYERQIEIGLIDSDWQLSKPEPKIPTWDSLSPKKQDEMDLKMAVYAAMIDRVDQNVGKLVQALKSRDSFDNTLILFLSDNGGCAEGGIFGRGEFYDVEKRNQQTANAYGEAWANASNTPFRLYKHYAHEGGTATPFFMHWPDGIEASQDWYREPAQLFDVMPTLLDVAGVEYPKRYAGQDIIPLEGVSLRPAFQSEPLERTEPLFVEHQNNSFIREGKWKLVGRGVAGPKAVDPAKWELYDMQSDRTETHDQAEEKADVVAALSSKWDAWSKRAGVYPKPVRKPRNTKQPSKPTDQPNIILILADDLGYSDLGCYGGEMNTPNIDALAAKGVRLTQVYNSARCCPSRASLMTGLYPTQAGIGDFTTNKPNPTRGPGYLGRLNDNCATIAEVLKPAGYGCYYVGKWHLHQDTGPIKRGFDEFYGYTQGYAHNQYDREGYQRLPRGRSKEIDPPADEYYATDVFNDYALEFIKQGQKSDQPWFVFLGHSSPHFPVQAPAERADRYDAIYRRGWDVLREERFAKMQNIGLIDGPNWRLSPRSLVPVDRSDIANGYSGKENPAWDSLDKDRQLDLARRMSIFAAMVEGVDDGVGKIVDHLEQTDDLENTLILFLSDNGACYEWGPFGFDGPSRRGATTLRTGDKLRETGGRGTYQSYGSAWANLGNTPFRLYKHFTHEGGISTPFIAHWPKGIGKPNQWVRTPAHVMDVLPTLMEAAGADYPKQLDGNQIAPVEGQSLLSAFKGASLPDRTIGFDHQSAHAIRQGDWKAVYGKRMPNELKWELYNLAEDRCEMNDLADQYPGRLKEMASDWETWAKRVGVIWSPDSQATGDRRPTTPTKSGSPTIANRPLKIEVTVLSEKPHGVAIAQGGNQHGFAMHFVDGMPAFDVRVKGKAKRLLWTKPATGTIKLTATLSADRMTLTVDDGETIESASPGLIPAQPIDQLSVGYVARTSAGMYEAPNRFRGRVIRYRVNEMESDALPATGTTPKPADSGANKYVPSVPDGLTQFGTVTKPLFADPNYNGSCDPEVVWNPQEKEWFIYYTARRATRESGTYVGTPLGVISSPDLASWRFRGYCTLADANGDHCKGLPDNDDTHWAPGVIVAGDKLHMYATYKQSAKPPWGGNGVIRHYVAPLDNPVDGWELVEIPEFKQPDPIDVSLLKVDNGYRAYYRVGKGGGIQWATSTDLTSWENQGKCLGDVNSSDRGFGYHEAPYVFEFKDRYWMLTDPHEGLAVFHSLDGVTWTQQQRILRDPGNGKGDATLARHPSVAVVGDRAFILYHTEPNRPYPTPPAEQRTPHQKISFLQMAELKVVDGVLTCARDAAIELDLPKRPNFVFILTDDQGWTGLSTPMDKSKPDSQSDFYQTPNIARLAAAGMRFPRGYSPAPNCSPSRYANLTGMTCARLSFTDIVGRGHNTELKVSQKLRPGGKKTRQIRSEDITIPELLKTLSGGYRTAHFGKWHLSGGGPERHGFDVSDGATGNREGSEGPIVLDDPKRAFSITSRANQFIEESVAAGRPFYCQVSHYAVHAKIQHRAETLAKTKAWKPGKAHSDPAYAAMVADLDVAVGQLLDQIEALGIADNTYIIYQADNGSPKFLSESPPLRRYKPEIWDGGIRVPTFISGPGIASNSQCDQPVMGIDFLPTIWEWAGGSPSALPEDIDGGSLVPSIDAMSTGVSQQKVKRSGELVVHSPHYVLTKDLAKNQRPSSAIIDGQWKLVAWYETGDVHLFDLNKDVSESTDVSDEQPDVKRDLHIRLRDYLSDVDALMPTLDPKHESNSGSEGDVDNDGLPDRWEFQRLLTHALGPDDDPDQDGLSNRAEFESNRDPLRAETADQ